MMCQYTIYIVYYFNHPFAIFHYALVQALSCLSGIELSALNVNVSELLDQTVAYFMGSGSSRFNSQVIKSKCCGTRKSKSKMFTRFHSSRLHPLIHNLCSLPSLHKEAPLLLLR